MNKGMFSVMTALAALVIWFNCLGAAEQVDALRAGSLELYPTFECVGIRLEYSGDADSNATAVPYYRESGRTDWREALPLARIKGNRFAGSIFFLEPGRDWEVEVRLSDPDGVSGEKVSGRFSTRAFDFPTGKGKHWWVSPDGDDGSVGRREKPLRTIGAAAAKVGAGDVVHVLPGVYRESVKVTAAGRDNAFIAFRAEGAGVVLSGTIQRYESPETGSRWQDAGGGAWFAEGVTQCPGYVGANGKRLYHYLTRAEFDEFICGEPGGWFRDSSGKLFVRLSPAADPNGIPMQIAEFRAGFHLQGARNVLIEGFEIRDYGLDGSGEGVHLDGASRCVVRDCNIHGMQSQVLLTGPAASDNVVMDCDIWDTSIPRWPWAMTKGHEEEGGGVLSTGGRGVVVTGCRMHGLFDGLAPSYWDGLWDESRNCDWDVYDNEIFDLRDDIIEPEGPCINFRFWNNVCYDLFVGVSLAPINVGPTYVLYNSIYDLKFKNFKYGDDAPGWCYILHNTVVSGKRPHIMMNVSSPFQAQIFRNNILKANDYALRCSRTPYPTNDLDYNCWFSTDIDWFEIYVLPKNKRLFQIKGREYPHLEDVRSAFGWGTHGIQAEPGFNDEAVRDLTLGAGSPCVNAGERLPNINDGFVGSAPDMGAFERGRPAVGKFPLPRRTAAR